MILGKVGEDFAVELDIFFVELIDKFGIADVILSCGGVYLYLPQPAEISFLFLPVGELERPGVKRRFFSRPVVGLSAPLKTFRML